MRYYKTKLKQILGSYSTSQILEAGEKEFSFATDLLSYHFDNNDDLIDDTTQAERDNLIALELENQYLTETIQQLEDGNELAKDIFSFVRKHPNLTDNQRSVLKALAMLLFMGDIEQAITDFNAIIRPTANNKMQEVYDYLKVRFDAL